MILISISFVVGCSDSTNYDHDDVVAVVRGEEITVGYIRFFSEVKDEDLPEAVDYYVRETLVIQEAKDMGIDVSEGAEEAVEFFGQYPSEDVDTERGKEIRSFADDQAEKFGMEPEEFHEEYTRRSYERSEYQNQFFKEHLGEPETEKEAKEMDEKAEQLINELLKKHEDEIEIIIKKSQ
ncbi:hypothetical protein [Aquisalibacillus elongatus]|nr:hypothetical protein [Aquisalibacillus elongatus]